MITLQQLSLEQHTDAGATATDLSGTVTVTSTGTVDTNTVGSYTITYSSTDASGNTGTATRTVNIIDTVTNFPYRWILFNRKSTATIGIVRANDLSGDVTFTISGSGRVAEEKAMLLISH